MSTRKKSQGVVILPLSQNLFKLNNKETELVAYADDIESSQETLSQLEQFGGISVEIWYYWHYLRGDIKFQCLDYLV